MYHIWTAEVPLVADVNQLQITAQDPAGYQAETRLSVVHIPLSPDDLRLNTDDSQVSLSWSPVPGATSYEIYWSMGAGASFSGDASFEIKTPPFIHEHLNQRDNLLLQGYFPAFRMRKRSIKRACSRCRRTTVARKIHGKFNEARYKRQLGTG